MLPFDVDTLATPAIYYREQAFLTEFDPTPNARHWFGGKLDLDVVGLPHGPHPLHRIVTLDLTDKRLGIQPAEPLVHYPLVYGMRYDGCELTYEVTSGRQIRIKRSSQQTSSDDWPYEDFPDTLSHIGLRLLDPIRCSPETFGQLTHQGIGPVEPDEMVVVIPSTQDYGGVSLWGEYEGGPQIVFYVSTSDRTVVVNNQCG